VPASFIKDKFNGAEEKHWKGINDWRVRAKRVAGWWQEDRTQGSQGNRRGPQRINRNIGTANEHNADQYANIDFSKRSTAYDRPVK